MVHLITERKKFFKSLDSRIEFGTLEQLRSYFKNHTEIEFDTETTGLNPHENDILSAQFGDSANQFIVDCVSIDIRELKDLLEEERICWLMQNAKFDLKFLYNKGIVPKKVFDTYLAESVLRMGIKRARKSLDYLVNKYCGFQLDKTVRGSIHREGLSNRVLLYAADDVKYLGEVKRKQLNLIQKEDLQWALKLDNMFVRALAYVEYCGFKLDTDKWQEKIKQNQQELKEAELELEHFVITNNHTSFIQKQMDMFNPLPKTNINWSSSQQVVEYMNYLGVDTAIEDKKNGGIKHSVEASVLEKQIDKTPFIKKYLLYKQKEKEVTTYGKSFLKAVSPVTERIHTQFRQLMSTGRMSCGYHNKKTGEEYPNLQNIPANPEIKEEGKIYSRDCFTPEPGNVFIVADYSGQEQVVLANQSKEPNLLEFYDKGLKDMHSFNASKIYPELEGLSAEEIKTNHKEKRKMAKLGGFAINYGGNGLTISRNCNIPISAGEGFYMSYMKAFSGLEAYWDNLKNNAIKNGYIVLNHVTKRKSYIDNFLEFQQLKEQFTKDFWNKYRRQKALNSDVYKYELLPIVRNYFSRKGSIERNALNYPVQGTSSDITKLACVKFYEYLEKNDLLFKVLIVNIVHDEIVVEAPKYLAKEIASVLQNCMEEAGKVFYNRVPLKAEPFVGMTWEH